MKIVIAVLIVCIMSANTARAQEGVVADPPYSVAVEPRAYLPAVMHTGKWSIAGVVNGVPCTDAEYIDKALYVSCRDGAIYKDGALWMTIAVSTQGESGLTGLTTDGVRLFAVYTSPDARLKVGVATPDRQFRQLVDLGSAYNEKMQHTSAGIWYHLNKLYVGVGDLKDAVLAQRDNTPNGKIFRVDAATRVVEVWAKGFRNPWTIALVNGAVYVGDYGEQQREEISELSLNSTGLNYGWPCYEGDQRRLYDCGYGDNVVPVTVPPDYAYNRDIGRGIAGIASVNGKLAFADFNGLVRTVPINGASLQTLNTFEGFIVRMKQTQSGAVVVLNYSAGKTTINVLR